MVVVETLPTVTVECQDEDGSRSEPAGNQLRPSSSTESCVLTEVFDGSWASSPQSKLGSSDITSGVFAGLTVLGVNF